MVSYVAQLVFAMVTHRLATCLSDAHGLLNRRPLSLDVTIENAVQETADP